jgi:HAD superfamily hydrolase (TIGR01509 family)
VSAPDGRAGRIKALIFDIGGVLEPPFDDVLFPALADMLGIPDRELRQRRAAGAVALSDGRMTLRDFYVGVIAEIGRPVDPDAVVAQHLAVYEAATARLDPHVLALIRALRQRHVVACLTNTEVEVGRFNRERGLYDPFDRAFLSAEMGLHKPDPPVYERVLAELACEPAEAVFTDDRYENVLGARATRLHGIHFEDVESFTRELGRLTGPVA